MRISINCCLKKKTEDYKEDKIMKNYMKISINGYPDSKIDAAIRACTVDNKVVQFQPQPDKAWSATYEGKELSVVADSDFPQSMEEFLAYLKQVRLVLEEDKLTVIPLREAYGQEPGGRMPIHWEIHVPDMGAV